MREADPTTSQTGATTSRMSRECKLIVITRTELRSYKRSLGITPPDTQRHPHPCTYDLPVAFSEQVLVLTRGTTYQISSFPFRFQVLCNSGAVHFIHPVSSGMPRERLSPRLLGPWMDWFTLSRRRRCRRSGYARVPCICFALWAMIHDPCTPHSGCSVGVAERVSRRLSPRLSPNSSSHPWVAVGVPTIRTSYINAHIPSTFLPSNSPAISGFEHLPNCQCPSFVHCSAMRGPNCSEGPILP